MRIEVRSDHIVVDGYVNAVERDSRVMTDRMGRHFVEQIMSGAFERAISKADKIEMRLNHRADRILGSTKEGLELYEDAIGLHARAVVTDPEVIEYARKKELKGWSFGFKKAVGDNEELRADLYRRKIKDLDLLEVSLIAGSYTPCYAGTLVETRAGEELSIAESLESRAEYMVETPEEPVDYSKYHNRISELERGVK